MFDHTASQAMPSLIIVDNNVVAMNVVVVAGKVSVFKVKAFQFLDRQNRLWCYTKVSLMCAV